MLFLKAAARSHLKRALFQEVLCKFCAVMGKLQSKLKHGTSQYSRRLWPLTGKLEMW
uniref:Uncharacterized protein n=1 Tax=Ailuropoda melanoleuca TaxID=9646 RepID=A0A7N5K1V8_AILME